jgi:hypothetical protein
LLKNSAGMKQMAIEAMTMNQSTGWSRIPAHYGLFAVGVTPKRREWSNEA